MEFITIKQDDNLYLICKELGKTPEMFTHNILNYLSLNHWIADASDEWGKTLGEILDEESVDVLGVAILSLKTNNPAIVEAFGNLLVVGHGDCPECGGEIVYITEGNFGKIWQSKTCEHCGLHISGEPDFDKVYEENKIQ